MKKVKKIILLFFGLIFISVLTFGSFMYFKFAVNTSFIEDNIKEEINIILPKSQTFKVTSTAKGDNQYKVARFKDEIFTFYLDNSGCTDPMARGNDKTMKLIKIDSNGEYEVFDSIPVWMHGNVLVDKDLERIYYTTYEEDLKNNTYITSVKIYTYHYSNGNIERINEHTLADDSVNPFEANPRVGADIDKNGNIAIAFSNYTGIMFVHVYDKTNDIWIKHSIEYYHDTYINDCCLYPYVKLNGINNVKIAANRDTSIGPDGKQNDNLSRDYTRYFSYYGTAWSHKIIADVRDLDPEGKKQLSAAPLDLYIDSDNNTHLITKEANKMHYYVIDSNNAVTEKDMLKTNRADLSITFVRLCKVGEKQYYIVAGDGIIGFKRTGYVEVYDYENQKLIYRNNSVCLTPYLYIDWAANNSYIDMMAISRDKNYAEKSDTHFIRIKII